MTARAFVNVKPLNVGLAEVLKSCGSLIVNVLPEPVIVTPLVLVSVIIPPGLVGAADPVVPLNDCDEELARANAACEYAEFAEIQVFCVLFTPLRKDTLEEIWFCNDNVLEEIWVCNEVVLEVIWFCNEVVLEVIWFCKLVTLVLI